MKPDARAFLEQWLFDNVHFVGRPREAPPDPRALALAVQCFADASKRGVSGEDLEREAGGTVAVAIHHRLVQLSIEPRAND